MHQTNNSGKPPRLRPALRRLWAQLIPKRRRQLLLVAGLMLLSSLAEMLSLGAVVPFLAVLAEPERIWTTDKGQALAALIGWQQPVDLVPPLCLAFAGAALIAGGVRLLTLRSTLALANGIASDLSIEVYRRTLYQPYAVHLQLNSSAAISAIAIEIDQVVNMLNGLLQLLTAGLVSLGLASLLLWLNPAVMLAVALLVGSGYGLVIVLSRRPLQRLGPAIKRDQTQRIRILQEGLGAIRDVILDGHQPAYTALYGRADRRCANIAARPSFCLWRPVMGWKQLAWWRFPLRPWCWWQGNTVFWERCRCWGPGTGCPAAAAYAADDLRQLEWLSLELAGVGVVAGLLEQPVAQADLADSPAPLPLEQEIRLQGVSFRYSPDGPWVLRDLDLRIGCGERIGIVGETGSGKSTLVDLLMGLLEPSAGTVLVDGATLEGSRLRAWRASIAHVPQSIFLADASIAENIAFGVPKAQIDQQRLERAAQQAQIAGFITSLPQGYATAVGERGVRLSGGQRQRIGIARALYKQAAVLVLDEATSALDQVTESEVMEAIHALSPNLTIVMIAHRMATLENCDKLVRIKRGALQF